MPPRSDRKPRLAGAATPGLSYDPEAQIGAHPWWLAGDGGCPDPDPRHTKVTRADLWLGRFDENGRLAVKSSGKPDATVRRYRNRRQISGDLGKLNRRLREAGIREDDFAFGQQAQPPFGESPLLSQYLPLIPGPWSRQLYWADYFAMSAKAFEAYWHDPVAHQAIELTWEFVLGKGIDAKASTDAGQRAWDDFCDRNDLEQELARIGRDWSIFGELFLEYFDTAAGLVVRSIDPATIYEVVTDQEDIRSVYFYHQQYATRAELYSPPAGSKAPQGRTTPGVTKYVVRQIPAEQVDHYRLNATSGEVRGRSDLFPVLGYLKRFRDYMTAKVLRADIESRFAFDVTVDGDQGQITALLNSIFPGGRPPAPASALAHSSAAKIDTLQPPTGSEGSEDPTAELLINMIAVGTGVPKEYLGITGKGARAGALVATEPAAKRFEDRQKALERVLLDMAERAFDAAGLEGEDREIEFTFPSIVTEDRSSKLKDIAFAESMDWISKRRGADIGAAEIGVTDYDFDDEQQEIAEEFDSQDGDVDPQTGEAKRGDGVIRRPMINATYRQVPKEDPTKAPGSFEDQPPGLLVPGEGTSLPGGAGAEGDGPEQPGSPKSRAGFPADENPLSGKGAANIRRDNRMKERRVGLTVDELSVIVREAVREGRRPRRRPDDPAFREHSRDYRDRSRRNLDDLAATANGDRP